MSSSERARRPILLAAALALVLIAAAAVLARPASAAVPGLAPVIAANSPNDSSSPKSASATCPPGKVVLGGGGEIKGGRGQVVLDDFAPNPAGTAFVATAYEDLDGTAAGWSVRAYAICADPLPGWNVVENLGELGSPASTTLSAFCPGDTRLTGPGAKLTGARGGVHLSRIRPNGSNLRGTELMAREFLDAGTTDRWRPHAYAICALPPAGLEAVVVPGARDSENKHITARCPDGKRLLGAGGDLKGAEPNVALDVIPASDRVTVTGVESQDGDDDDWAVTAHAICATP